jgi:hypothetical protein
MSLLNNAVESIQVGVEDYLLSIGDSRRSLSAVRNICAGILLLYKEKLCQLSPSNERDLLIKKVLRPSYDDQGNLIFVGKGKNTVDVQEIRERFISLAIKVEWDKFEELNRLRNEVEHYYTTISRDGVREIVAKSFVLIKDFIQEHLKEQPCHLLGDVCWQALLDTAHVYAAEEDACRKSLAQIDWKYQTLKDAWKKIRCLACHSSLIKTEDKGEYDTSTVLICSSCGKEFNFGDVAEKCLSDSLAAEIYVAVKDGGEIPLEQCPGCDNYTFMCSEEQCALCDYEQEYFTCDLCGTILSLDEQWLEGFCSGCHYASEKLMAE